MDQSRSLVMRALADNAIFSNAVYPKSFVLMEYFGYLKRDPDGAGFDFWLSVMNNRESGKLSRDGLLIHYRGEYQRTVQRDHRAQ